jgi:hypothetical protein
MSICPEFGYCPDYFQEVIKQGHRPFANKSAMLQHLCPNKGFHHFERLVIQSEYLEKVVLSWAREVHSNRKVGHHVALLIH